MTDDLQIRFRNAVASDLDYIMQQEQHEENVDYINHWSHDKHRACLDDSDFVYFIVERIDDRQPVGFAILIGVNDPHHNLEFFRLAISEKGRGYGRQVMKLAKRFAFEETGAHRLWLDLVDYNERAYHIYESEGFVKEGVLREACSYNGRRASLIVMSMLRSEYER